MGTRTIVIVAPPDVTLQDVTGPWEVFSRAAVYVPGAYRVVVASTAPATLVRTKFGLPITCHLALHDLDHPCDTVLVAGSDQALAGEADPGFLEWLRGAPAHCRRVGSICTGAFYLALSGLLSRRRATTHWRWLTTLSERFPDIRVEADPIFVRDEFVYTSAGITAGIDLSLSLVEEDCGPDIARAIARDMVVFLHRGADQSQLSAALAQRMADRDPIRDLQKWAPDHLDAISSVEDMAAFANMSPRNFARLFKRETGVTPGQYVRKLRVEAAKRRLHEASEKIDAVASQVGFGSAKALRRSFQGSLRSTPSGYRKSSKKPPENPGRPRNDPSRD